MNQPRPTMNIALWIMQVLWGVFFCFTGFGKILCYRPDVWNFTLHQPVPWFSGARVVKNPQLGLIRPRYLPDLVLLSENPLADVKVFYATGVTRVGQDRKEMREECVKYTIRDGVVFDSHALLSDVRDMVAKARQARSPSKGK